MKAIHGLMFLLLAIFIELSLCTPPETNPSGTDANDEQYFNEFYTALGFDPVSDPCTFLDSEIITCFSTRIVGLQISTGMSGTLSSAIGQLSQLNNLSLFGPGISGTIPTEFGLMKRVYYIAITGNPGLVGEIPTEFAKLSTLLYLSLSGNSISGTLNTILTTMDSLQTLYLNLNKLTGTIDSSFGTMRSLNNLDLSNNQFCGTIPKSFVKNTYLPYLFLLGTNNICPITDYSIDGFMNDYTPRACDGCATAYSCCDAGLICLGGSNQAFTCEIPIFDLTIETTEVTTGSITITLVGSKASSQHNLGAIFGTVGTQTISNLQASADIGDLRSIKVTNSNPNDPWTFSTIDISGTYTMSFGKDIKVKNSRVLDGPINVSLKTKNTQASGTTSTIYITFNGAGFSETRGITGPFVPGDTKQVSFSYMNIHSLQNIVLGSFSIDEWDFDYIEVTFLGITKSFSNTSGRPISKYNHQKTFTPN